MSEQQLPEQQAEAQVISEVKEKAEEVIPDAIPTPPEPTPKASAQSLKERLQWGEPSLTIIDARDRDSFLAERITGAMLIDNVDGLSEEREIYVYANNDQKTAEVASQLRQDGFVSVSQLQGGLAGWKAIQGATEGREASAF
ncbi:MAG: rhodanese-like domain-containing protein [Cyanobacteria bacterium P01_G01_bin.67]